MDRRWLSDERSRTHLSPHVATVWLATVWLATVW